MSDKIVTLNNLEKFKKNIEAEIPTVIPEVFTPANPGETSPGSISIGGYDVYSSGKQLVTSFSGNKLNLENKTSYTWLIQTNIKISYGKMYMDSKTKKFVQPSTYITSKSKILAPNETSIVILADEIPSDTELKTISFNICRASSINTVTGLNSIAIGGRNTVASVLGQVIGNFNKSQAYGDTVIGSSNKTGVNKTDSTYGYNVAIGQNLQADGGQVVLGRYNTLDDSAVFVVGNGTDSSVTSNALTVNKTSGDLTVQGDIIGHKADGTEIKLSEVGGVTVTDTYSSTSTDAMSGKAVASAISGKADSSTLGTQVTYRLEGTTLYITTK